MTSTQLESKELRKLLKDIHIKLLLESPKHDFQFEYYTTTIKDPKTEKTSHSRTYRLNDLIRGNVTQEPWDKFDLDKQAGLVDNLLNISKYRVVKIVNGWTVKCPECGHITEGNIWENTPKTCRGAKCKYKVKAEDITEHQIFSDSEH